MEPSTHSPAGPQLAALVDLLQAVFRPLFQEAMAGQLQSMTARPSEPRREYLRPQEVEEKLILHAPGPFHIG